MHIETKLGIYPKWCLLLGFVLVEFLWISHLAFFSMRFVSATLRPILNKSWKQHPTRRQLYDHWPPISKTIQVKRRRHARHCWRSNDGLISDVLWAPAHGRASISGPVRTYLHQFCADTGCSLENLPGAMDDRSGWGERESLGNPRQQHDLLNAG